MVTRALENIPTQELKELVQNWQETLSCPVGSGLLTEATKRLIRTRISEVEGILWTREGM